MEHIHDNEIIAYYVNLKTGQIVLITLHNNYNIESEVRITFSGVIAHYFENELNGSTIFDIQQSDISSFIQDNISLLNKGKPQCWPMYYSTLEEFNSQLSDGQYRYFIITSSYGLSGWVLAKEIELS